MTLGGSREIKPPLLNERVGEESRSRMEALTGMCLQRFGCLKSARRFAPHERFLKGGVKISGQTALMRTFESATFNPVNQRRRFKNAKNKLQLGLCAHVFTFLLFTLSTVFMYSSVYLNKDKMKLEKSRLCFCVNITSEDQPAGNGSFKPLFTLLYSSE